MDQFNPVSLRLATDLCLHLELRRLLKCGLVASQPTILRFRKGTKSTCGALHGLPGLP